MGSNFVLYVRESRGDHGVASDRFLLSLKSCKGIRSMALNDMYQLTHDMTMRGKNIIQVYHCQRANPAEDSSGISDAWQNSVLPSIQALQSDLVINNEIRIFNLGDPLDFKTVTLTGATGFRVGADSPTFIAASQRYASKDRTIRAGQKRFTGMLETDYTLGALLAATVTLVDAIGTALTGNWLASADSHIVANYAVIGRVCETTDPVTGKCLEYRLPETDLELKFYLPDQFATNPEVSSQVSRKTF